VLYLGLLTEVPYRSLRLTGTSPIGLMHGDSILGMGWCGQNSLIISGDLRSLRGMGLLLSRGCLQRMISRWEGQSRGMLCS